MYTEEDLVSFAVYRNFFGDTKTAEYKNVQECLFDWKQKRAAAQNTSTNSAMPAICACGKELLPDELFAGFCRGCYNEFVEWRKQQHGA